MLRASSASLQSKILRCYARRSGTLASWEGKLGYSIQNSVDFDRALYRRHRVGMKLSPAERARLESEFGVYGEEFLRKCLDSVEKWAICPISGFQVGVVGETSAGGVYFGFNLEFQGLPLNFTTHAEQFLMSNVYHSAESTPLEKIYLKYAPCGHCRQFLQETENAGDLSVTIFDNSDARNKANVGKFSLLELLPKAFGPGDLGVEERITSGSGFCGELEEIRATGDQVNGLVADEVSGEDISAQKSLQAYAQAAAGRAYVPYTSMEEGVALRIDGSGNSDPIKFFTGSSIESAAYNPTLSAMHSALIQLAIHNIPFGSISAACIITSSRSPESIPRKPCALDSSVQLLRHVLPDGTKLEITDCSTDNFGTRIHVECSPGTLDSA